MTQVFEPNSHLPVVPRDFRAPLDTYKTVHTYAHTAVPPPLLANNEDHFEKAFPTTLKHNSFKNGALLREHLEENECQ